MLKTMQQTIQGIRFLQQITLLRKLKSKEFEMSVKFQHPEYQANIGKWLRCETVANGQDAVYAAGQDYLPRLSDQDDQEYEAYLKRTPFYNASWRTIVGLQGMLFRKPPQTKLPPVIEPMIDNITLDGKSLHIFALGLAEECLKVGRLGVFVDYPQVSETATKADAIAENHRPLLRMYRAKSIINWKTRNINNATVLSMVVLQEARAIPVDEFEDKESDQYRVLDLVDIEVPQGDSVVTKLIYRVREIIVEEEGGKEVEKTLLTVFPKINGKHLEAIPFQFIGVDDVSWEVDEPPLIDLIDLNLSHFRTAADYEHGCHFTGLPTPVISGHTIEKEAHGADQKFHIGSMTAWVFANAEAKATFLEFKGEGLNSLKDNLNRKEKQMAVLGARMLEVERGNGVESANTAAIHRGGEQSMLSSVAQAISIGVTKVLKIFARFAGAADTAEVKFELNRDFFPAPMDSLTLTALIAAWQNSAISYETLFENLKKGEIVRQEATHEDEQKAIEDNPPILPSAGTTPGSPSPNAPSTTVGGTNNNPTSKQLQRSKITSS
jgi:hypothetical protein